MTSNYHILDKVRKRTVKDFDNQWKLQGELNDDYWASDQIIFDIFSNLISIEEIKDKIRSEISIGLEKEKMINDEDKELILKLYKKLQKEFKDFETN